MDLAGNEGPPSEPIELHHGGFSRGGCGIARLPATVLGLLAVVLVLGLGRALRRSNRSGVVQAPQDSAEISREQHHET